MILSILIYKKFNLLNYEQRDFIIFLKPSEIIISCFLRFHFKIWLHLRENLRVTLCFNYNHTKDPNIQLYHFISFIYLFLAFQFEEHIITWKISEFLILIIFSKFIKLSYYIFYITNWKVILIGILLI